MNKKHIRWIGLFQVFLMILAGMSYPVSAAVQLPFKDVSPSSWFYDGVRFVYDRGLMIGTAEDVFSPDASTTRAMIVTILHRAEGKPAAKGGNYKDVPDGQWYSEAVNWATDKEIVNGYGGGMFGPNDPITREQMAAILFRYSGFKEYDVRRRADLSEFADRGQISPYAEEPLEWAKAAGLIKGVTKDILDPKGEATRAQVATIFWRYLQLSVSEWLEDFRIEDLFVPTAGSYA